MTGIDILLLVSSILFATAFIIALLMIRHIIKVNRIRSITDEKTGLKKRDAFLEMGKDFLKDLREDKKAAMIVFDIEQFGKLNTLFGTEAGDNIISGFAQTINEVFADCLCTRFNTDDFGVLLCYENDKDIYRLIDEVSEKLNSRFSDTTLHDRVTYRAGIALYDGCDDIYTLFNKASLCTIIRSCDKVTYFTNELENRMVEDELLYTEMLTALNEGQFELYYQPKICFNSGHIIGVEALIRWNHPTKGFIPPSDFIPLAEQTGIITQIDEWGLRTACRQCKQWQEMGLPPVKVSVNMSQAQFYRTDVIATVKRVLEETSLDPKWLEIEVTETMAMQDIKRTVDILANIRSMGVSISMDDFGSGYSSLSSLKTIPLDILKIDRSLVCDLDENETSRRITGAIVELGKAMKLVILAEGVETLEQCKFLTEIGCDLAQGYYYSKPCPADQITALLLMPDAMRLISSKS